MVFWITHAAAAEAGLLSGCRNLTNEMGEAVWGFESNCPGGTEVPTTQPETQLACIQGVGLSLDGSKELGVKVSEAQEYIWVGQAINERRKMLYANYRQLSIICVAIIDETVKSSTSIAQELKRLAENVEVIRVGQRSGRSALTSDR